MSLTPFIIDVSEKTLNDLKSRLSNSRLPEAINENGWSYGTNLSYMRELLEYWLDEYNWREKENYLNSLMPQFITEIDGAKLHFVYKKSRNPEALTLVLTHGWPGSIIEFHKIINLLCYPEDYGGELSDAFDVVCPSLAGYAWSDPVYEEPCDVRKIAKRQVELMKIIGIEKKIYKF